MTHPIIVWFRQDLRVYDNPALQAACDKGQIIPLYIVDDENAGSWANGSASKVWLHYSLHDLNNELNNKLVIRKGDAKKIIENLVCDTCAAGVYWNRCYEPWRIKRDKDIKAFLESMDLDVKSFNGSLLWEPWTVLKDDDTPYKVFTPFYKKGCLNSAPPREPVSRPASIRIDESFDASGNIDDLALLPKIRWDKDLVSQWDISMAGAGNKLDEFIKNGLRNYKEGRNFPAGNSVSKLSPYLHFGNISPNQVWYAALHSRQDGDKNRDHFLSELGWREFSYNLLYHFPSLPDENLQSKFDNFPWVTDNNVLEKWQKGITGFPIVDAGMRELYETGYMHNRLRMIVGSFLVKNLLIDWRHGERWFWDCLFDADLANNSAGWQWIAGSGADAAPYFRIFNPTMQSEKFDPEGKYIKKFVPELKDLDPEYIHDPSAAPALVLRESGVRLGENYPEPIVSHKETRERALKAFESLKEKAA